MIYRLGSTKQTWSFGDFLGSKLRWLFSVLERNLIVMESIQVHALAASKAKGKLEPFEFSLGSLEADRVDITVQHCGICHSDLSILNNEFGWTKYPFVPGHEAVGVITAKGAQVPKLEVGQTVGLGWFSASCMACSNCLAGDHNHCTSVEQTLVGRYGAFATHVVVTGYGRRQYRRRSIIVPLALFSVGE